MPKSSGFRNTYTSQFVPLPLEQFARTNELNQAKQDQQVAALGETDDALWKVKGVADADNEYVAGLKGTFEAASSELVNKDLTQRENQDAVKGLIKGVSRDKDLNTIMTNATRYQEWQKNKEDQIKAGTYHPANDAGQVTFEDYAKSGGYKSGKTIDPNIYKYEDARPVQEQYFNNLQSLGSDQLGKIGETYYKFGYEGISEGRIGKQAQEAIASYMSTPAAAQEGRMYDMLVKQNGGKTPTKNGKKLTREGYIFDNFLNAGMERAGMSFKSGIADAKNTQAKADKEETNIFGGALTPETPSVFSNGREVEFDDKGSIKGSGKGILAHWNKTGFSWDTVKNWYNDESLNSDENSDLAHVKIAAKLNGISDKQAFEVFDKTSHMVEKPLVGKPLEEANKQFRSSGAGLWSHMNMMNISSGERNMNFTDAVSKLADEKGFDVPDPNKSPKEYNELLDNLGVRVTGTATPNYFSAKPVVITIGGNTFAADMTYNGKKMSNATQAEIDASNYDKLQKFGSIIEKDSKGEDIIYYKNIKSGRIEHKKLKDLKD